MTAQQIGLRPKARPRCGNVQLQLVNRAPAIERAADALLRIRMQRFPVVDRNLFPGLNVPQSEED